MLKSTYLPVVKMGQLNLHIDDKLEDRFRRVAAEKFGAKKGFLKKAIEEAIKEWISKNSKEEQK